MPKMRAGGKGANFTALRHKRGSVAGRLQLRRLDSTTSTTVIQHSCIRLIWTTLVMASTSFKLSKWYDCIYNKHLIPPICHFSTVPDIVITSHSISHPSPLYFFSRCCLIISLTSSTECAFLTSSLQKVFIIHGSIIPKDLIKSAASLTLYVPQFSLTATLASPSSFRCPSIQAASSQWPDLCICMGIGSGMGASKGSDCSASRMSGIQNMLPLLLGHVEAPNLPPGLSSLMQSRGNIVSECPDE